MDANKYYDNILRPLFDSFSQEGYPTVLSKVKDRRKSLGLNKGPSSPGHYKSHRMIVRLELRNKWLKYSVYKAVKRAFEMSAILWE